MRCNNMNRSRRQDNGSCSTVVRNECKQLNRVPPDSSISFILLLYYGRDTLLQTSKKKDREIYTTTVAKGQSRRARDNVERDYSLKKKKKNETWNILVRAIFLVAVTIASMSYTVIGGPNRPNIVYRLINYYNNMQTATLVKMLYFL